MLHIDLQTFSVASTEELRTLATPIEVVIKGSDFSIGFSTCQLADTSRTSTLSFDFLKEIKVTQRRNHARIAIDERYNFFCEGRFRDGFNHKLRIKDLSRDGVGLLYEQPLPELTRSGMLLKNMVIMPGCVPSLFFLYNLAIFSRQEAFKFGAL